MTITTTRNGSALTLQLEGRLDTTTSPQLEAELSASLDGVKQLTGPAAAGLSLFGGIAGDPGRPEADEQAGTNGSAPCERDHHGSL